MDGCSWVTVTLPRIATMATTKTISMMEKPDSLFRNLL
jgi:hypothetical protein